MQMASRVEYDKFLLSFVSDFHRVARLYVTSQTVKMAFNWLSEIIILLLALHNCPRLSQTLIVSHFLDRFQAQILFNVDEGRL